MPLSRADYLRALVGGGEGVSECREVAGAEDDLVDALVAPEVFGLGRNLVAPILDCGVFGGGAFPNAVFGLDDPVDLAGLAFSAILRAR